jgi:hypothetical protein
MISFPLFLRAKNKPRSFNVDQGLFTIMQKQSAER